VRQDEKSASVLPRQRPGWVRRLLRLAGWALLCWLILTATVVALLRFVPPPTTAFMLAHRWSSADAEVDYRWVPLQQISSTLPIALVAAEDQRFLEHFGFDLASIQQALAQREQGGTRGASTISQQVAKNLFLWSGRSWVRKGLEAYFTVLIELLWSKQRIMEVYANIAEFGPGIYGAQAASMRYFGRPAQRLTAHQAALLAAVLPNPKQMHADRPTPYVSRRAAWIDRQVRQLGGAGYFEPSAAKTD
jgi:monofunctional biosynthetic peptidoglycan transglycosylase